jgi:hypothetical protein|tara:strand:+ start:928 stop:1293 length:366 start_codon:yes stop_codon:yes gene_type:complete
MSTPLKKGLGDYTKGEKFTLKSGNSPAFKMMGNVEVGDSPITNSFGIGKGTSPYKQEGSNGGKGKKVLGTLANMFMAGINNVYGTPGSTEKPSDALAKSEAEKKALEEQLTIAQKIIKGEK